MFLVYKNRNTNIINFNIIFYKKKNQNCSKSILILNFLINNLNKIINKNITTLKIYTKIRMSFNYLVKGYYYWRL